jgi:heme-degrading monooxygenase HmoA
MIRHAVIFSLNASIGSAEEAEFLAAAAKLSSIPGVRNFESLRQTSKKNDFDYGLSMEFDTAEDYAAYNIHPEHTAFIQNFWLKRVNKFLEIDFEPITQ